MSARFRCWFCGRFAKFIRYTPYLDEYGGTVRGNCKKCGECVEGT